MNKEIISEHIISSLEDIIEQTNTIFEHSGKIPQIELDIVMGNIRNLYEHYTQLNRINQNATSLTKKSTTPKDNATALPSNSFKPQSQEEKEEANTPSEAAKKATTTPLKEEETAIITPVNEASQKADTASIPEEILPQIANEEIIAQDEPSPSQMETTKDTVTEKTGEPLTVDTVIPANASDEDRTEEQTVQSAEEETEKPKAKSKPKPKSPLDLFSDTIPTIADKFKDESPSLNQRIVEGQKDKSIASRMQKQPISDLTKAIGINEKFLFINDLFNGNMSEYTTAVKHLNNECPDLEQAKAYIADLHTANKWENKPTSADLFIELIERRFIIQN